MGWRANVAVLAIGAGILVGCSGAGDRFKAARPKTAPAAGSVTLKGQPLDGAFVLFHPAEASKGTAAAGFTNASGEFIARAFPPDEGAVPGVYKVTVEKSIDAAAPAAGVEPADAHDAADRAAMAGSATKSLIPEQYTKPETTPLKLELPAEGNREIKLELN